MRHDSDKGSFLVTVMIILAVILMLLGMLVIIAGRDLRTSNLYGDGVKAYFIAYSGISEGIAYAKKHQGENHTESRSSPISQYTADHSLSFTITFDDSNPANPQYKIVSTGTYRYNSQINVKRTLEAIVKIQGNNVDVISLKEIDS